MEHFFPDAAKTGGVFFEMGAIDGVKLSNTYLLDRMGWRGLLIEANPLAAKMYALSVARRARSTPTPGCSTTAPTRLA